MQIIVCSANFLFSPNAPDIDTHIRTEMLHLQEKIIRSQYEVE